MWKTFGQMLNHVAGQAFAAAGFALQDNPMHHMRGLFRYRKLLADPVAVYVEWQMLDYGGNGPSRFRVNLLRSAGVDARASGAGAQRVEKTLSRLLWDDFDVRQLGSPDHWWTFRSPQELGFAIAEAGKLVFAFGVPWLEGNLHPDAEGDAEQ